MTIHRILIVTFLGLQLISCNQSSQKTTSEIPSLITTNTKQQQTSEAPTSSIDSPSIVILGTIQDAGSPHIGCKKSCCTSLFDTPDANRKVVSLGVIDPISNKTFLFEATPDITTQLKTLKKLITNRQEEIPDGIFLTHAHIGHYTGLMYLGKEATNAKKAPVYAMPKMKDFLEKNGPWSQLVTNENIQILPLENKKEITLTPAIQVTPFTVPHRDEYSETVGYYITGPNKKALFIPDIDKWEKWDTNIIDAIASVDYAFIDATFFDGEEINNRDISEIPHPFIIESMRTFKGLSTAEKSKVYFIHFNHTNPVINAQSKQAQRVLTQGFNIAQIHDIIAL
ncbi:MBL fold metallo-hydrolase [Aquimarina sp. TRL1]|uniref:MBL fold metallo-hydrolase n=1 Tax=Aquimarina sp. (strain TRL1) TaxID=2736252 RepID=UPI001588D7D9|nr:MBL fold metallo-hydrolase [Aquimarina sp. TRL1]QKX03781.1 MBL fold metallo-hydrolase [Aquimarina sp. TRL1]